VGVAQHQSTIGREWKKTKHLCIQNVTLLTSKKKNVTLQAQAHQHQQGKFQIIFHFFCNREGAQRFH
jgi:hypothetical protein